MTTIQIRKRMESLAVKDLDELRSQLELALRDTDRSEAELNSLKSELYICRDVLDHKNTVLNMHSLFGFNFDPNR